MNCQICGKPFYQYPEAEVNGVHAHVRCLGLALRGAELKLAAATTEIKAWKETVVLLIGQLPPDLKTKVCMSLARIPSIWAALRPNDRAEVEQFEIDNL